MAEELVRSLRRGLLNPTRRHRQAVLAVAVLRGTEAQILIDPPSSEIDKNTLFEIGSITKTMTGTLLAVMVVDGTLRLTTTVGDVLGDSAGRVASVTVLELATHTAGLPRLAPNAAAGANPSDPYAHFGEAELIEALTTVEFEKSRYSNFGFQLLGHVLAVAGGERYEQLLVDRVLTPASCSRPRFGEEQPGDARAVGHVGDVPTQRWRQPLGGAGAVELGIADLAKWMKANVDPEGTPIGDALRLAQRTHIGDRRKGMGLGWNAMNGRLWHNGGTGGFHSYCVFVPGVAANAVLTNVHRWNSVDLAAMRHLTRLVQ